MQNPTRRSPNSLQLASSTLLAACLTLGISACTPDSGQENTPPQQAASTSQPAPSEAGSGRPGGGDAGLEGPTGSATAATRPTWSGDESKKASETALKATKAFVDTSKSPKVWYKALKPYLNADTASTYANTDPEQIPYGRVEKVGTPEQDQTHPDFVYVPVQVAGGALIVELKYSTDYKDFEVVRFTQDAS